MESLHKTQWTLWLGKLIANEYLLTNLLGHGASSAAFEFRGYLDNDSNEDQVMVVTIEPRDPKAFVRIRQDLTQCMWLDHPNIVMTHIAGVTSVQTDSGPMKVVFKVQDRLEFTLLSLLEQGSGLGPFTLKTARGRLDLARSFVDDISAAIEHLHQLKHVHLDLNARNVMYGQGRWQLIDFETGRYLDRTTDVSQLFMDSCIVPPEAYSRSRQVSAESARGAARIVYKVSPAYDYYALGALAFNIVTGQWPALGPGQFRGTDEISELLDRLSPDAATDADRAVLQRVKRFLSPNRKDRVHRPRRMVDGRLQSHFGARSTPTLPVRSLRAMPEQVVPEPTFTGERIDFEPILDGFLTNHRLEALKGPDGQLLARSDEVDAELRRKIRHIAVEELDESFQLPRELLPYQSALFNRRTRGQPTFVEDKVFLRADLEDVLLTGGNDPRVSIQRTDYLKSCITMEQVFFAMAPEVRALVVEDHARESRYRLLDYYVDGQRVLPACDAKGSSHVGVSTVCFTLDGILVMPTQGEALEGAGQYVPSGSGSADYFIDTHVEGRIVGSLDDLVVSAMTRELIEEGGLHASYRRRPKLFPERTQIASVVTGYGRLVYRAFKPEFYGVSVTSEELANFRISEEERAYISSHNMEWCRRLSRTYFSSLEDVQPAGLRALRDYLVSSKRGAVSTALVACLSCLANALEGRANLLTELKTSL